ncbi:M23 family metallopeptidase [Candidatus Woesearchaeota archaeon]|nr:M23 family metallopeptidase [Candidatus Woesearchaeota archaeon]
MDNNYFIPERRTLLKGFLGLIGLSALSHLEAFAKKGYLSETLEYVKHKKELALRIPVRKGDSYYSLAELYTGTQDNGPKIQDFNDNVPLSNISFVPERLLRMSLKKVLGNVLYKKQFVVYEIEKWGDEGINSLWELIHDFMNDSYDFYEKKAIILCLNFNINPRSDIVYDEQKIIVPSSLVKTELIRKPKKKKFEVPKEKPKIGIAKQNPLRVDISYLRRNLDPEDKYGARRLRSLGGGRYSATRHTGIDLDCPKGTNLYPIQKGRLIYLGKDRKLWRNGIIAEYITDSGLRVKYCHLSRINKNLKPGQEIYLSTILGKSGDTGNARGYEPHVHIGVRKDNKVIDPTSYVFIDS